MNAPIIKNYNNNSIPDFKYQYRFLISVDADQKTTKNILRNISITNNRIALAHRMKFVFMEEKISRFVAKCFFL